MNQTCDLSCSHCKGYFLKNMATKPNISHDSFLLSGGCDTNGMIKIDFKLLKELKKQGKTINLHSGIVDEKHAKKIGKYADVVSFDFVTNDEIIKKHYSKKLTEKDYINSYISLSKYCRVVPHVMIGYGNEIRSLEILHQFEAKRVVILVLISSYGNLKINHSEPTLEAIEKTLKFAKKHFTHITLGCMRPLKRKKEIDRLASRYVDAIVNPHKELGLSITFDKCCALLN